ncbi:MAG: hypothetical protein R3C71_05015 [Candidatus Krumholzibacteriia bacterium]|nr:hypothetical protein [bacterium]
MNLRRLAILSLLALPLLTSCARSLRSTAQVDPEHEALRLRYLEKYPDDPFRDAILAQTVRKGMTPTEVYLAWGKPLHRFKKDSHQNWLYEFKDSAAGDGQPSTVCRLFFVDGVLTQWRRDRHFVYFEQPESEFTIPAEIESLRDLEGGKRDLP